MRLVALPLTAAVLAGCSTVLAGCSATTTTAVPVRGGPPVAGNSVDAVITWVQAGREAPTADFHTADRDGEVTDLGEDVAFRSPGELPPRTLDGCMTYHVPGTPAAARTLACLAGLSDPPPKPAGAQGQWVGGWVEFDGATITVGGLHGDPGPFGYGVGRPLLYGERLRFGDFQCRSDPAGLYCVNDAHHSAVLLGDAVITFGCVEQATAASYVGKRYDCPG